MVLKCQSRIKHEKLSGSAIGGADITAANLAKQYRNEVKILSSQPGGEYSIEGAQWGGGHGVFTYHLIQGLSGAADINTDREVTLEEIDEYLQKTVPAETKPLVQMPLVVGNRATVISTNGN